GGRRVRGELWGGNWRGRERRRSCCRGRDMRGMCLLLRLLRKGRGCWRGLLVLLREVMGGNLLGTRGSIPLRRWKGYELIPVYTILSGYHVCLLDAIMLFIKNRTEIPFNLRDINII